MNRKYFVFWILLINITQHAHCKKADSIEKPLSVVLGKSFLWGVGAVLSCKSSMACSNHAHALEQEALTILLMPTNKRYLEQLSLHFCINNKAANMRSAGGLLALLSVSCACRIACDLNHAHQATKKPNHA